MKKFLLYLWQLPQNLLGLILLLFVREDSRLTYKDQTIIICNDFPSGISLGNIVVLRTYPFSKYHWNSVRHEYGHCLQSRKLGWLYLIVIGLPSLLGNIWDRIAHTEKHGWSYMDSYIWYYNQPWEKWADELGEVKR